MKIILTFDYELFFGARPGSPERAILEPVEALLRIFDQQGVKACFFVDAGYLWRLSQERQRDPTVEQEYVGVARQIRKLVGSGHEIGLHVHPHWEDTFRHDCGWRMNTARYRLIDFDKDTAADILRRYKQSLEEIVGHDVSAYRAGGWCIQPFDHIRAALLDVGIKVDSSVFCGGRAQSDTHYYDFRGAENLTHWRFDRDPVKKSDEGLFWEVPISSMRLTPLFFWRLAATRQLGGSKHKSLGDGDAMKMGGNYLARLLFWPSSSAVSMDGLKSGMLMRTLERHEGRFGEDDYFVPIGHPKAATPHSLEMLKKFVEASRPIHYFTTFSEEQDTGGLQ